VRNPIWPVPPVRRTCGADMIPVVAVTWRLLVAIGFIAIQKVDGYLHQRFVSHKKTLYTTNSDQ
jgi:hypothetical protein